MQFIQCFGSSTFLSLMCDNYYHIYCQHYTPKHAGDALWVFHTDKAINNFRLDLICSGESAQLAGISGDNWWDIQTKQNKDKPGNAMLPARILSEKQTNKKFAGTSEGRAEAKVCKSSIFSAAREFSSLQKDDKIRPQTAPCDSK